MKKTTWFIIIQLFLFIAGMAAVASAETLEGYITGHLCGGQMSMICPREHIDSAEEHIVFISKDGESIYEIQGVDQKQLREQFTYLVRIEGKVKDNTIEVHKIIRIGKSEAGKKFGEGAMHSRPGRRGSSAHQ